MNEIVRSTEAWETELGTRIRLARKRARMSQQTLADRASLSKGAIRNLEAGRGSTLSTFVSVVRALGLDSGLDRIFNAPATVSPVAMFQARSELKVGG